MMNPSECQVRQPMASRKIIVSVNGVEIARQAIAQEMQNHAAKTPVESWTESARGLVVRELLLQEARALEVTAEPEHDEQGRLETEEEALVRELIAREVRTPKADEAACRRYYQHNISRFRSPALCEVRHILYAAAPEDQAARDVARSEACAAIEELRRNSDDFPILARQRSACPSAAMGGNLGQIGPGQTVPEFEQALAAMAVGSICPEPVETRYGFHVIALDRRIDGETLPFELVCGRIGQWLEEQVYRRAVHQYIAVLAGRARIEGVDLGVASASSVQ